MPDVFQPFLDLLTNPPGNLIYHLVVAFSLVAVLPVSLYLGKSDEPTSSRRLLIGFCRSSFYASLSLLAEGLPGRA